MFLKRLAMLLKKVDLGIRVYIEYTCYTESLNICLPKN